MNSMNQQITMAELPAALSKSTVVTAGGRRWKPSSKLGIFVRAPFRALCKARDMYVSTFAGCAGRGRIGPMMVSSAPRAHRFNSRGGGGTGGTDEDIAELIRLAARRKATAVAVKSRTMVAARIDEDRECEFGDDVVVAAYPRSRSQPFKVLQQRRSSLPPARKNVEVVAS